jgi:hypothetical protein
MESSQILTTFYFLLHYSLGQYFARIQILRQLKELVCPVVMLVKIQDAAGHLGVNKLTLVASLNGDGGSGPQSTEDRG